jgi:hypothetical protein
MFNMILNKYILILLTLGYDFNEYEEINFSDSNFECLRYWPSEIEIDDAISIGYERAIHLARYLEMTTIPNDAHYFNIHKRFPVLQLEDFWEDNPNPKITDEEVNSDSSSISQDINRAASAIDPNLEEKNSESGVVIPLEKTYGACQVIVKLIQKLPDIPWFPNGE